MNHFCKITAVLLLTASGSLAQTHDDIAALRTGVSENLVGNILPFWADNTVDPDGGFYGTVIDRGLPVTNADKGAIMNARILWTFSRAYRMNPINKYKTIADRAAGYYTSHFIDSKHGGVFWSVDADGNAKDMTKQTYAAAFGIYGLAEHFRATGDTPEAWRQQRAYTAH